MIKFAAAVSKRVEGGGALISWLLVAGIRFAVRDRAMLMRPTVVRSSLRIFTSSILNCSLVGKAF
jgi:hypothetical protein